jgi:hypothetical protein
MNEKVGFDDTRRITIHDELKSFLKIVNAVQDVDVRDEGICGFDLVHGITSGTEGTDAVSFWDNARGTLEGSVVDAEIREEQMVRIEDYLLVKTGIQTGGPTEPIYGGYNWFSYYLFCRSLSEDEDQQGDNEDNKEESYEACDGWAWRIVFESTSDSFANLDSDLPVFDTIPEFLDWYSTWDTRDRMRILMRVEDVYEESGAYGDGLLDEDLPPLQAGLEYTASSQYNRLVLGMGVIE